MQPDSTGLHPMLNAAVLLVSAALLFGCEGPYAASQNPRPRLVIDRVQSMHSLPLAQVGAPLSPTALRELDRFLAATGLRPGDGVGVTAPADRPAQRDAAIRHLLGLGLRPQLRPELPAAVGTIVVTVDRYVVATPECQVWTGARESDFGNRPLSTFGCANLTNLGLMVADPADLIGGDELGNTDGVVAGQAIQRYREGKTKPFISRETGSKGPAGPTVPGAPGGMK